MQAIVFIVLSVAITALAMVLSLKQRWLGRRRTLVLRSIGIWAAASIIVVVAGAQLLGAAPLALSIAGSCVVILLAGVAGAAR
jgi:hypothetical protein